MAPGSVCNPLRSGTSAPSPLLICPRRSVPLSTRWAEDRPLQWCCRDREVSAGHSPTSFPVLWPAATKEPVGSGDSEWAVEWWWWGGEGGSFFRRSWRECSVESVRLTVVRVSTVLAGLFVHTLIQTMTVWTCWSNSNNFTCSAINDQVFPG